MRKSFFSSTALLLLSLLFLLNACQKENSQTVPDVNSNQLIETKIDAWIEGEKTLAYESRKPNIDLLKKNLDFSKLRIEKYHADEQIIIIPVKYEYKRIKHIGDNKMPNLVLIVDKSGNIKKGNLVLYIPKNGEAIAKVPDNTFYHIFNTATPECNGMFKFLSISGGQLYQLEYDGGKMISHGEINKGKSNSVVVNVGEDCIDWFLVTTYYYTDGTTSQTEEYMGRTCGNNECEDVECLDPGSGNGGGGGNSTGYMYAVTKPVNWVVAQPQNNWWYVKSYETLKGEKVASEPGGGHFTSITHSSSAVFNIHIGGFAVWEQLSATAYLFSGSRADCNIAGKVTFPSEPTVPEQDVNKTEAWVFQAAFP